MRAAYRPESRNALHRSARRDALAHGQRDHQPDFRKDADGFDVGKRRAQAVSLPAGTSLSMKCPKPAATPVKPVTTSPGLGYEPMPFAGTFPPPNRASPSGSARRPATRRQDYEQVPGDRLDSRGATLAATSQARRAHRRRWRPSQRTIRPVVRKAPG